MRLIDADKFKENILSGLYIYCQENKEDIANAIDSEPTITPSLNLDNITEEDIEKFKMIWQRANNKGLLTINEEKPHGKWEYNQYDGNPNIGNWHCSNCHNICYEMKLTHDNYKFCPNCGADMRGIDNG